jgi:hypothetical protein
VKRDSFNRLISSFSSLSINVQQFLSSNEFFVARLLFWRSFVRATSTAGQHVYVRDPIPTIFCTSGLQYAAVPVAHSGGASNKSPAFSVILFYYRYVYMYVRTCTLRYICTCRTDVKKSYAR